MGGGGANKNRVDTILQNSQTSTMLSCSIIISYTAIGMLQGLHSWPCTDEHVLVLGHRAQGLRVAVLLRRVMLPLASGNVFQTFRVQL